MWSLDNLTPYAADSLCTLAPDGARVWNVVVKITYTMTEGQPLTLADEQVPPILVPEFSGEEGLSSLAFDADLGPAKPATDVVLRGSAYAPGGRPATEVMVTLKVGDRLKSLRVQGPRTWVRDISGEVVPGAPQPFLSTPFSYEDAYGGYDSDDPDPRRHALCLENPVGTGVAKDSSKLLGTRAPRVEQPDLNGRPYAAGFGPVASHWAPRVKYAGTYDGAWFESRKPLLPTDFDPRYHQFAPPDQQFAPHLRGGTPFGLKNLTPGGLLTFVLPKHYFAFETFFGQGPSISSRAKLSTVILEPDENRLMLAYHTEVACHARYDDLDTTRIRELEYVGAQGGAA